MYTILLIKSQISHLDEIITCSIALSARSNYEALEHSALEPHSSLGTLTALPAGGHKILGLHFSVNTTSL